VSPLAPVRDSFRWTASSLVTVRAPSVVTLDVVKWARILSILVSEPTGEIRIGVTLVAGPCRYDLRLYGPDEMAGPAWRIGIFSGTGERLRTAVSPSTDLSPVELELWLRAIAGRDVAEELVRLVGEAVSDAHCRRGIVGSSR
jgi:hypothetical protein